MSDQCYARTAPNGFMCTRPLSEHDGRRHQVHIPGVLNYTFGDTVPVTSPAPQPAKAAGNCVGRLCAYERALTEEYPDGIEEDSDTLPDPARAAQRVADFLRVYGDARVCVAITPLAQYQIPPLYGRDLQALLAERDQLQARIDEAIRRWVDGQLHPFGPHDLDGWQPTHPEAVAGD